MARTIQGIGAGDTAQSHETLTLDARGANAIDLPGANFISASEVTRDGDDLVLETEGGEKATIEGYFAAEPAPLLQSPDGAVLTPDLVHSFVRAPMQYAANETATDESPVGAVEEVKGHATVTRADGTVETITSGTPIYQGDVVETDADGAVNIVFLDETSMAVSAGARLAIDEYSYDPSTESGTTNFSVLRGLFVFTSGLIGRDDPDDVKIDTPVGSIGIRGTIIAGEINPGGESNISVLEGAIVIHNGTGDITLTQQFETVRLTGFDQPMKDLGVLPAADFATKFGSIGDVNASLFTTINDAAQEQSTPSQNAPQQDAAPEPTSSNDRPDALTPFDSSVPTLDTSMSNGLPTAGTVAGETASGLAGTASTGTTGTAPAPIGATPPPAPPAGDALPAGTLPPTVIPTQPAPPTGTTPTAPTTPLSMSTTGGSITDISGDATEVRFLDTGLAGTVYTLTSNPNSYFVLNNGAGGTGISVQLTPLGAAALAASLDVVALGGFEVTATLGSLTNTQSFSVTVTDANANSSYDLDGSVANVSLITDDFEVSGVGNKFGYSITALGDINDDGFDDFLTGNSTLNAGQNHTYYFEGALANYASGNLIGLSATYPLTTPGLDHSETVVAGIGDFNGDGVEDFMVGQYHAGALGYGNATIVSGANPLTNFMNTTAVPPGAEAGYSVDGIGDFNNDGYADVLIGMPGASGGNGAVQYVGGHNTGWTSFTPITVTGINGGLGMSVTGLGDFNGDGYSDFAIGAPTYDDGTTTGAGKIAVMGGYKGGGADPDAQSIGYILGTTVNESMGTDVLSLGDINGDGRTDLYAGGATDGKIFFGSESGIGSPSITFSLGSYMLSGGGGIGDFNGDGFDDFTVSLGDASGMHNYVVFGKNFAAGDVIDLTFLKNPTNALEFTYSGATDADDIEIAGIGDINGDGYDDFAMNTPDGNGGTQGNGGMFVFYGHDTGAVSGSGTATYSDQRLVGSSGNDVFDDDGYLNVSMRGGAGQDTFKLSNTDFLGIDGGGNLGGGGSTNYDFIKVWETGTNLDFSNIDFEKISGIEAIHFADNNQKVTLTVENLFNLLKTSDDGIFRIANDGTGAQLVLQDNVGGDNYSTSNPSDIISLLETHSGGSATHEGTSSESGNTYDVFKIGGYQLLIDTTVTVDAQ